MFIERPTMMVSDTVVHQVQVSRREIDSAMVGAIIAVGGYLAVAATGLVDTATASAMARKFLGVSAPLFAAAGLFLLWVVGALVVELAGLTDVRRRWDGIAA